MSLSEREYYEFQFVLHDCFPCIWEEVSVNYKHIISVSRIYLQHVVKGDLLRELVIENLVLNILVNQSN